MHHFVCMHVCVCVLVRLTVNAVGLHYLLLMSVYIALDSNSNFLCLQRMNKTYSILDRSLSARLVIERPQVQVPTRVVEEFSSPGSTFCADSYFGIHSTPCYCSST